LSGKKLPSGMKGSLSLSKEPGALLLAALVFSGAFLSFFAGTVAGASVPLEAATVAEFRLDTQPNSSECSVLGLWDLRGEERENRLRMEEFDPNDGRRGEGRSERLTTAVPWISLLFPFGLVSVPAVKLKLGVSNSWACVWWVQRLRLPVVGFFVFGRA
jgi:hypothetical protein